MLEQFLPSTRELLRIMTECRALIGGVFALAFLLRDAVGPLYTLDIYADDVWFQILVEYLMYSPFIAPYVHFKGTTISCPQHRTRSLIRRESTFSTATYKRIRVRESTTVSACSPISRSWTSALMNFVTETSFGCAYPRLTLNRRGLVSDMYATVLQTEHRQVRRALEHEGFSFASHPAEWADFSAQTLPSPLLPPGLFPCFQHIFLCPDQGRYFGDRGSLVSYLDPLLTDPATAYLRGMPPYGPMAAWRLWVAQCCERGCVLNDPVLHGYVLSSPLVMTNEDAFHPTAAESGTLSDPRVLASLPIPVRGRGRALTM
ncbi:hypothetical protein C8Q76DRAFT_614764 [Earliella scabrosa]|nr:hypothetical protein C8Q76DRAFT_614764 [Earliella scabrosa]